MLWKPVGIISEHDHKIANKLGYVMAGGDLSEPTLVTEQYLLDLEREAFLSLCTERKTLERIEAYVEERETATQLNAPPNLPNREEYRR